MLEDRVPGGARVRLVFAAEARGGERAEPAHGLLELGAVGHGA
jgi:hypothetical protein